MTLSAFSPQTRLFTTLCLAFCVALLTQLESAAFAFVCACLVLLFSRSSWKNLRGRLLAVNIFLVLVWALTPFSTPGKVCCSLFGLPITEEGLLLCALVTCKCNAIFLLFHICLGSATVNTIARAMTGLHVPNKLVTLFMLTAHQLSGFSRAKKRLDEAASLRGFQPRTDIKTYRTYGAMLGLLLLRVLRKSVLMREALLIRNFQGLWPKHHVVPTPLPEKVLAGLLALGCVLFLCVDRS